MVKKYRKKPVVIEAIHYDGGNWPDIRDWAPKGKMVGPSDSGAIMIATLEGNMAAMPGDYIIKGVQGEFYPCKPEIFKKTYEEVTA